MVSSGAFATGRVSAFFKDARGVYQSEALAEFTWLDHGFSTRHSAAWLAGSEVAQLKQIHSDVVVRAESAGVHGEGDALLTNQGGVHVAIRTADCLPVLLVDPKQRAVAAIHSGWRGTVAGIAAKAVSRMAAEFGSRPADLHAAIGPGIGACCYEVGPEVSAQFGKQGRVHLDLSRELAGQLEGAGLSTGCIHLGSFCTFCHADEFWSYRREKEAAGRMWSAAAILAK